MKPSVMNKHITVLLHIGVWLGLFLMPLMMVHHDETISWMRVATYGVVTLLLMFVFYLNYFWLTPKFYVEGDRRVYWVVNVVLVVGLAIAQHFWLSYAHTLMQSAANRPPRPMPPAHVLFLLRNIFNLGIAAAIASTIVLSKRWHQSEDERLKLEAERKEAELRNLRSQINPHFLLNTLNNIYALTAFDKEEAQKAIQELSKMLRHMLYDNQEQMVSLSDEVQFLENYVNLMKLRLPTNVRVAFNVNLENTDAKVAPLIFISLVENAFKHGVSPTKPSFIDINISADEQRLICFIENTNFPKSEQDHSGHGIGLQQVASRLELIYPQRYSWIKGPSADGKTYQSKIEITNK